MPDRMLMGQIVSELVCKIHALLVLNVEAFYLDEDRTVLNENRALELPYNCSEPVAFRV
jgi:hypothetical protein